MIRYSCDMCGKDLTKVQEGRFVLKMESCAVIPTEELTDEDMDADHLEEIGELLSRGEELPEPIPSARSFSFDLCHFCHAKFLANPLNVQLPKFDFSEN
ncbi:hypothetical protein [Zavarzinella formosa]|uniref:hypothetical protein n=1 Tax=Zavarzinella formosa TaxID=360055 RepID=UPI00035DF57F|nr:hypothetical protein [Zavarzinella formosa]